MILDRIKEYFLERKKENEVVDKLLCALRNSGEKLGREENRGYIRYYIMGLENLSIEVYYEYYFYIKNGIYVNYPDEVRKVFISGLEFFEIKNNELKKFFLNYERNRFVKSEEEKDNRIEEIKNKILSLECK